MPPEDERSNKSAQKDRDDDVSVEVHGQQHDDVRNGELQHMDERADELLEDVWGEGARLGGLRLYYGVVVCL